MTKTRDWRRNWLDDGDDCISSAFAEAGIVAYGGHHPDVTDIERAYRLWHPDWDDRASTMRLDWYWQALASIGLEVHALHERGRLIEQFKLILAAGLYPVAWYYLKGLKTGQLFHHASVVTEVTDTEIGLFDQQVGLDRRFTIEQFENVGAPGGSSGYGYVAYWRPRVQEELSMAGIVDLRGKLPVRAAYGQRDKTKVTTATYHYTASSPTLTPAAIARYQISPHSAAQTGTGEPFPGLAYTAIVDGAGVPHLAWDVAVRVWHAPNYNDHSVGICYIGNGPPTTAQIEGLARLHLWAEDETGHQLGVRGHKDDYATTCPAGWDSWRGDLIAAINRQRMGDVPAVAGVTKTQALDEIWRVAGMLEAEHPHEAATIRRMVRIVNT